MAEVKKIFPGVYQFMPETDPVKIAAAQKWLEEFGQHLDQVVHTKEQYGWDSPQCQLARIDLQECQRKERERKRQLDQADSVGHTIQQ